MPVPNTKDLVDMGFGTAVTCSFAIPEVGPGIAAALDTGKLLFDLFYPADKSGQDPLTMLPTMADLKNAMNDLKADVAATVWANQQGVSQANVIAMTDAIADAIRNAGATKTAATPLPGDTTVWNSGVTVALFDPVMANPSPLLVVADLIEGKASEKYRSIGLYTLTVSTFLNYCKTAMTWEINENLKDYLARHATWKTAYDAHRFWEATQSGPEPDKPGPEPVYPTDGDHAVGSEDIDQATHVVRGYRSYLGKKPGENISCFTTLSMDQAAQRTKYLDQVIADRVAGKAARAIFVKGYLDQVTVATDTSTGTTTYYWVNGVTGDKGDPVSLQILAQTQAAAEQGKLRGTYEKQWNDSNIDPDDLTDDDITTLQATLAQWQATVAELAKITAAAGGGGGNQNMVMAARAKRNAGAKGAAR
jgi:hypothetical protein